MPCRVDPIVPRTSLDEYTSKPYNSRIEAGQKIADKLTFSGDVVREAIIQGSFDDQSLLAMIEGAGLVVDAAQWLTDVEKFLGDRNFTAQIVADTNVAMDQIRGLAKDFTEDMKIAAKVQAAIVAGDDPKSQQLAGSLEAVAERQLVHRTADLDRLISTFAEKMQNADSLSERIEWSEFLVAAATATPTGPLQPQLGFEPDSY